MSVCSMIIERMSKVGGEKRGEGEEAVYETVHQVILQPNGGMTCLIVYYGEGQSPSSTATDDEQDGTNQAPK